MSELVFAKELNIQTTEIPGLLVVDLPVHGDARGWFKENWQREKMTALGLPDFKPVQNNISFNAQRGVTRGIHAEPWDKYVSVASGKIFGAWVDLREGESFGKSFTIDIDPSKAVFVPRGVGNAFQALEDNTAYTYLVNDHWSAAAQSKYTFLNLADETVAIQWPIALTDAELSDKDKLHPRLQEVTPMPEKKILVTGAGGQLGKALRKEFPNADFMTRDDMNIASETLANDIEWGEYGVIINAAAYTKVDVAETAEGRKDAWNANATGVKNLSKIASINNATLVHISSDYVFDGEKDSYTEQDSFAPLGVYGQTKAAGDIAASLTEKHYILRTSWVIGDGDNFVKTMFNLAQKNIAPTVVNDQFGRLSFTEDIAAAIKHLLSHSADFGTYNISSSGEKTSWSEIAKKIYELSGKSSGMVTGISSAEYFKDKDAAPRPKNSFFVMEKIEKTGFQASGWENRLINYIESIQKGTL